MKTAINVALILASGFVLGAIVREMRAPRHAGPPPGEVVYTDENAAADNVSLAAADVENDTPTKPPEDEEWLSRFELTERSGETVSSNDLEGTPYVVSFFFSTCPSICVQQNQKIQELQEKFKGRGVKFVAISVDPETDTPEVLRDYSARFGADPDQWLFLTGDLNYIRRIGAEIFRQPVNKQFHTERFVLVDGEGKIEGFYNWPEEKQFNKLQQRIDELIDG
ncbi:SCO family protein [Allorhodopirellula solitaria]|uniref:Thioredoxin domain-containing protein n=1 Tax=Allorhodopirellula solitaria TaxID=2527987 RepID=A0A5C5XW28_9BACT|nr:SCO family protein [Allorhodopirellula solitaria]TWT66593.1 hypothetical protein CA85_26900 [Allorhodopirellula solitaria]